MPALIRQTAAASAGEATNIAVGAFSATEIITALRNGSGNLELIMWYADDPPHTMTRGQDSGTQAGAVQEVALALLGRRVITAVRDGDGDLLLIPWQLEPDGTLSRLEHVDAQGGEATNIAIAALDDTTAVTALRAGSGRLLLIPWRSEANGSLTRLNHDNAQGPDVTSVAIASLDEANVVTAVRAGIQNQLVLSGWTIGSNGSVQPWPSAVGAGTIGEVAIASLGGSGLTRDVVTAVQNADGNLLLIAWRLSLLDRTITRLTDSGGAAGTASDIAICSTETTASGRSTILVSMRRGAGNLELIAFELIADADGHAVFIRIGDASNEADTDVADTALTSLGPDRIVSAARIDDNLAVASYGITRVSSTLIVPIAEASAGDADHIALRAFTSSEALTAFCNGDGDLELISWHVAARDFTITRGADSGSQAGPAQEVALAILGRQAITAVRSGSDALLLMVWNVPTGLTTIVRGHETGTAAGEADLITMTVLNQTMLVTAVRNGSGHLLLIVWRLEPDGTLSRLNHENAQAGDVSLIAIETIDNETVVTAVRNGADNLELIAWSVSSTGVVHRWPNAAYAGEVGEITIAALGGSGSSRDIVTAVQDGSGNLLLIAWRLSVTDGTFTRLADSGDLAGEASDIAICSTVTSPSGGTTIVVSMRRGSENLELIAFDLVPDDVGGAAFVRTGDATNRADMAVLETALTTLEPGRVMSAVRTFVGLQLTTYGISDAARTPAPASILELRTDIVIPPVTDDTSWSKSSGTYPIDKGFEWAQVEDPSEDYDDKTLMACSGWVVAPENSGADVPFSHPFGFDWEFEIAPDDPFKGLLSRANARDDEGRRDPNSNAIALADALGIETPQGLLGLEWDLGLLPQSFRGQVNHGDRVAVVGRWILDQGHETDDNYRTEIHPPLILASGSVQRRRDQSSFTRALFLSRPFLVGQTYSPDLDAIYNDAVAGDGTLLGHIAREVAKIIELRSRKIEVHPKIKSFPFRGAHRVSFIVRPPVPNPDPSRYELAVSFQFTRRPGCQIKIQPAGDDAVEVTVSLDESAYTPPALPTRTDVTYITNELDKLSPGQKKWIVLADYVSVLVTALVPWGGLFLVPYVAYILNQGLETGEYDKLPEFDIRDATNAVLNVAASQIPDWSGVIETTAQPYPMFGWLEVGWISKGRRKRDH